MADKIKKLYNDFELNKNVKAAKLEIFHGVGNSYVYNPSVPFIFKGKEYIAARVENTEQDSHIVFFKKINDEWYKIESVKLNLQDPSMTIVNGEYVLTGINVTWGDNITTFTTWKTDFYIFHNFDNIEYILSGPEHMKDIRILELKNGKVGVFGRPQGDVIFKKYGKGIARITYTEFDEVRSITKEGIENAYPLEGQFEDDEWGGANHVFNLSDELIGVIGHHAYMTQVNNIDYRHYYTVAYTFNRVTKEIGEEKVIMSANCFPPHKMLRPDLEDVVFTSGIINNNDGTVIIYTGISDANVGTAIIDDPFKEFK